ncbi:hypothetical protein Glove_41g103 [Diversispora epigaea]|uniref:Serine/threonine-protein kinase RIO1 n=1 Tax=Diversispora epigaea TaxID=1348612 RepID=A0A397JF66_9GLOM|nr:hypothetical protein Glove_41g103 [Diversispora epigaea]
MTDQYIKYVPKYEAGQFDDAPDDNDNEGFTSNIIKNTTEILKNKEFEEEEDDDFDDYLEDELNYNEEWDDASGDFTKQYNRLKQQLQLNSFESKTTIKNVQKSSIFLNNKKKTSKRSQFSLQQEDKMKSLNKYANRIHLDDLSLKKISTSVSNDIKMSNKKAQGDKQKYSDKSDRATTEQVLDPRTRIILFKMINRNIIYEINGCISTGKEANVYHAVTEDGTGRAIKVYKTSILIFKDRDRYVTGEFRFRHGYSKHNPRKMVKLWAEKEMRNLKRLWQAGIPCPEPLVLRLHVLVMSFLGDKNGWAFPRLKDAVINSDKYPELYHQIIKNMRTMYHTCRLVHADLSEYNLLYNARTLYIIDVSQSVEHDHPHALEFLRNDCINITEYFKKKGVRVMSVRELFDFITDVNIGIEDEKVEAELDKIQERLASQQSMETLNEEQLQKEKVEEEVFKQSYIPRTLGEVIDVERDTIKVAQGEGENLIYRKLTGLSIDDNSVIEDHSDHENEDHGDDGDDEDHDDEEDQESESEKDILKEQDEKELEDNQIEQDSNGENVNNLFEKQSRGKRNEDKDVKKERKKLAKEEAREKRKHKMPKAEKKKKIKATSGRKSK